MLTNDELLERCRRKGAITEEELGIEHRLTDHKQQTLNLYKEELYRLCKVYDEASITRTNLGFARVIRQRMNELSNFISGIESGTIKVQPSGVYKECEDTISGIYKENNKSNNKTFEELIHESLMLL